MNTFDIIGGILLLLSTLIIILLVVLQRHDGDGMSAMSGGGNQMAERGRTKTRQTVLAKWTRIFGIVFVVLSLVVNILNVTLNK